MKIFYIARSLCFLLFSTLHFVAYTQTKKLRFEHPTLEKGLRNISVKCMLQDSKGYLWVGTFDGLVKYDGYNFIYYRHIAYDTTSLIDNWVISLWEDKDGTIWIGTAEAGLSKFDRRTGKFTQYRPEPDSASFVPPFRAVSAINEGGDGSLWAGNWLGELRRFNKRTGTYFPEKYDLGYRRDLDTIRANNTIFVIFKDRSGIVWVGDHTGLHKINAIPGKRNEPSKISFTHYRHDPGNPNSLSSNMVTSIFEDHTGMLWIGTGGWGWEGGGLNKLNPKTGIFTRFQHDAKDPHSISSNTIFINNIVEDTAGNLWIGTENGLNKLNKDRTQFASYFHDPNDPQSIGGNFISSLLTDRSHSLWVGVSGTGGIDNIDKIDPNQKPFVVYRHNPSDDNSLSNDNVTGIYGDKKGITWISTFGGLDAFDKNTGTFTHYRHDPDDPSTVWNDNIYALSEDKDQDGNMWVYSGNSPFVASWSLFNSNTGKFKPYSRDSARFREIYKDGASIGYEDSHGLLWLGTINGLKRFDHKTGETIHYRHDPYNSQGPADNNVRNLMEDNKGYLWIGHASVGITRLDIQTGIFTHYLPDVRDSTTLSSPVVYSIYQDSKGNLWFGTKGGGLCRFNYEKETFTTYSEKQGLADNNILSIMEDIDGNLWLGTLKGISRFSPATQAFMNYDSADGLPGTIYQNVCFSDRDGILYYGGSKGLTVFDPRQLKPNPYTPPVVITQFTLFDKPVLGKNEAEEILLNHDENFFSFEFSALNYTNSSKNQYAYQLVGVDKDWVYSGTRRVASYTNIGPGEYTFRVKASNNDGIWNEKGTSVRIIIHPPWWRTWWAYSFYGLCLLAGIFALDRYQRRRLIQKEREQTRERELAQAQEIEQAYKELKSTQAQLIQSEKMASLGELTAGIAHEIQNPLNFVNNFSEVNKEMIVEMKEEIDKGNYDEVKMLANDIEENEDKINHHGKRADAIVKGMLQHSKQTSGIKELTDINALCDEYLRLSYHGLRAKDKSFNATMKTDFDESIGKINIVPQDIGRVLLNLFNNAFYAVSEKSKNLLGLNVQPAFVPTVAVVTKKLNDKVEIRVTDNGNGIPQNIVDKIFQPFFTTKPTGQGTGLGLSLAYDIITKEHGGTIKVESKEGEGTEFIILLPI